MFGIHILFGVVSDKSDSVSSEIVGGNGSPVYPADYVKVEYGIGDEKAGSKENDDDNSDKKTLAPSKLENKVEEATTGEDSGKKNSHFKTIVQAVTPELGNSSIIFCDCLCGQCPVCLPSLLQLLLANCK